ncbi:MAG: T9SS type A sorting domain-containing protein [Bacteroidia bacterium]
MRYSSIFFILISTLAYGQNLVPNASFEDVNCPVRYTGFPNQIDQYVNGWRSGNCASPDLYAPCSEDSITRPPAAWYGSETAHSGTNFAAVGFYNIGTISWYEYLVSELVQPLQAGQRYDISYWASRADSTRYASDALGIAFSSTIDTCPGGFDGPVLPYTPAITADSILTNANGWTRVQGSFIANGTEQFLLIGCFTRWDLLSLQDFGTGQNRCYYYVDDIEVKVSSSNAILVQNSSFSISPNPASDILRIKAHERIEAISIIDLNGKTVKRHRPSQLSESIELHVHDIDAGLYCIQVQMASGEVMNRKVLVE